MTFHFAHLAPPGATPRTDLAARWVRCPLTHRLVMHWDRRGHGPAIPAQHAPVPAALPPVEPRTA